jgi:hypothetical protein
VVLYQEDDSALTQRHIDGYVRHGAHTWAIQKPAGQCNCRTSLGLHASAGYELSMAS